VATPLVRRLLLATIVAGSLVSCSTGTQSVNGSPIAIPDLFRMSIRDAQLAISDEGTRNATADGTTGKDWHIESVVEFRKGPNQRFSVHIT
jgi:hypothetical protein